MGMDVYRFVVKSRLLNDPRSTSFLADAHALGFDKVERIQVQDVFFIEGILTDQEARLLASQLLYDPITQEIEFDNYSGPGSAKPRLDDQGPSIVEVALHPGVTDPVAEQIVRASHIVSIEGIHHAATGQRFVIWGQQIDRQYIERLASRLLANATIQTYIIGRMVPVFPLPSVSSGFVEQIDIRSMTQEQLLDFSLERRAALDIDEMSAIQAYCQQEQKDITDIEFETIAQTWSEHCVHKTFRAQVTIHNPEAGDPRGKRAEPVVNNLLNTYLRSATNLIHPTWLLSAFVDNAGIVEFDNDFEVSFKVETHNHPSAIEPFGGANTGVGGVIRDVIGVSAKPIAATDVLCFGPSATRINELPAGVLHPRRISSGVIAGVQDYGNKIGIPTVSGAILYDPGFTANPLVFCGCVGIAPKGSHPRQPKPGDRVILLGGKTGRDGLRGATFSSMTMDAQTGQVAGASVQIGAPIVEKGLIDVIIKARDAHLYNAITDCGAGGLSSAVGEMASVIGADIELNKVQLKYPGLAPWEIWLSEAQERMVLAVPPSSLEKLKELCDLYDVEMTDIGTMTDSGHLVVRYDQKVCLDLKNSFLHEGIPQRKLQAVLPIIPAEHPCIDQDTDYIQTLKALLAHPNIASKEGIIRIYDHEVQGGTVIKPMVGKFNDGPSDSVVIKPAGTPGLTAIVLGVGINPEFGKHNPYRMAISAVDEAIRNVVATGGDPDRMALLDNFCWGDPKNPETLGTLVEAARACYDGALYYRSPFISGKDSLNNEYLGTDGQRHAIPPTLLISSISVIENLENTITMDLKNIDNPVYLLGEFRPRLQGSHYAMVSGIEQRDGIPDLPENAHTYYQKLHRAIKQGMVKACHDLSEGGLLVAAAEMCIAGRLGLSLEFTGDHPLLTYFGETNGCFLIEVSKEFETSFNKLFDGSNLVRAGKVEANPRLSWAVPPQQYQSVSVDELIAAWKTKS